MPMSVDQKITGLVAAVVVLFIIVIIEGFVLWNYNTHFGIIDAKGRAFRAWAQTTATWSAHVARDHLASTEPGGLSWDHVPPPPNPPPEW